MTPAELNQHDTPETFLRVANELLRQASFELEFSDHELAGAIRVWLDRYHAYRIDVMRRALEKEGSA